MDSGENRGKSARRSVFGSSCVCALFSRSDNPLQVVPRGRSRYLIPRKLQVRRFVPGLLSKANIHSELRSTGCTVCARRIVCRTRLGETEVQDLALGDQIFNRTSHVFDWHFRIDAVLVVKINTVGSQALQRFLSDFLDVLWLAIETDRTSISKPNFVAITTLSRKGSSASPTSSSFV